MTDLRAIDNSDLEYFANHLGFEGIDTDLFYETYYLMDSEEYDIELDIEEYYDAWGPLRGLFFLLKLWVSRTDTLRF